MSTMACLLCKKDFFNFQSYIKCLGTCQKKIHTSCVTKHSESAKSKFNIVFKKTSDDEDAFVCSDCVDPTYSRVSNASIEVDKLNGENGKYIENEAINLEIYNFMKELKHEMSAMRLENISLKNEISGLKNIISNLVRTVSGLKSEIPNNIDNRNLARPQEKASRNIGEKSRGNKPPLNKSNPKKLQTTEVSESDVNLSRTGGRYGASEASTSTSASAVRAPVDSDEGGFIQVRRRAPRSTDPVPLRGTRLSSSLRTVVKTQKKAFFITRLDPGTQPGEIERFLKDEFSIEFVVCTRLRTKFDSYSSFHVLVNKNDFDKLNHDEVWPEGILATPYLGQLKNEKKYTFNNDNDNNDNDGNIGINTLTSINVENNNST